MKVWQIKKINQFLSKDRVRNFSYSDLLKYNEEDLKLIIEEINKDNKNTLILMDFLNYYYDREWDEAFTKIAGDKNFYKNYIIKKIIEAESYDIADYIYNYYDLDMVDDDKEACFTSVDEWVRYMDYISSKEIEISSDLLNENIYNVLIQEGTPGVRLERLDKVIKYSELETAEVINDVIGEEVLPHIDDILDLLLKGYSIHAINQFLLEYKGDERKNDVKFQKAYDEIIQFLKETKLSEYTNGYKLLSVLNCCDIENYPNIISIFNEMEGHEHFNIFSIVC